MEPKLNNLSKAELTDMLWSYKQELLYYLSTFDIGRDHLEDALQDTMYAAWKNIDQLRDVNNLKSWLFIIAKNIGIKYVKMNNADKCRFIDLDTFMERLRLGEENPFDDSYISDRFTNGPGDVILEVTECLKPKEAKVVLLNYIYGHKLNEIAHMIGESYDNTKQISSRAMKKLRKHFKEGQYE